MIVIIKSPVENRMPEQNFSLLSQCERVLPLIDYFDPHLAPMGHKKGPNLPLGCFFQKSTGCVDLSIYY